MKRNKKPLYKSSTDNCNSCILHVESPFNLKTFEHIGGGKRQSNFEALRLLSMLMVLNLHSFWGFNIGTGLWQAFDIFRESTSICAVDCFILISGYFGIKWRIQGFFNLVFQLFFYSIGIYLFVVCVGIVEWNVKEFLWRFACLITHSWGFVLAYVLLYFCSPVLNVFSDNSTLRSLLVYIIILFFVINFICLPRQDIFVYSLVYLIGRLLRRIDHNKLRIPFLKAYWITTICMFCLVYFLLFKTLHITNSSTIGGWPVGVLGYNYASPLCILQAVFLFLFFSKLHFNSNIINWCAKSCFAIFLIHMHPTIKHIGYYAFTRDLYIYPVYQHILLLVVLICFVYVGSILVDQIRILVSRIVFNQCKKIFKMISANHFVVDDCISIVYSRIMKRA